MRISDWSSDVCSSDLNVDGWHQIAQLIVRVNPDIIRFGETRDTEVLRQAIAQAFAGKLVVTTVHATNAPQRSEERRVGKSVSVRVDLGGRRILKKKK